MKHFLIPFLFISTAVFAQNTANKVERYKINPAINDEFKKPLLGKVKTMHTAHYFIEYNKYDTIKKELFDNNYTYGFDKEGREILFIEYDMLGNISSKYERRYNEKDSLTYLRKFIWGENFGTYIEENSYFYNPLGLLQELKGYSLKESDPLFIYRELYKYNDKQQLLESHYYSNDTLIETVIRSYNDRGKLIYLKGKLDSEYKLEYDERGNLIKKDYYFTQFSISQKSITKYQYDEQNRLILATENIDGDENILIKNIYKDNLPIEIYEKNRSGDEIHVFYHYKENQLIEEEKYTRFFNGHYYSTTKEKIQYDEKCRIKKFYDYEEEKIVRTYTHYYDDKDRIIKTELLYSNNSNNKKEYWTNSYDMANNLTKTIYKNNKEADKDIYRYDKNNNLLSEITYKGNKIIKKIIYTYDSYQNLIKIEKYNNGKNYIYERTFTYYE